MGDEQTPQTNEPAIEQPSATQEQTPDSQSAALSPDNVIEIDGESIRVEELIKARKEAEELRTYKEKANVLLRDGAEGEARWDAMRYVLKDAGYTNDQVNDYIGAIQREEAGEQLPPTVEDPAMEQNQEQTPRTSNPEVEELRAEVARLKSQTSDNTTRHLQGLLDKAIDSTLDGSDDVKVLLETASALQGKDGHEDRSQVIRGMIYEETMRSLHHRKDNSTSPFDPQWFSEEAVKAASEVAKKYRAVIGDPSKLGRAPETVTGNDMFVRMEEPTAPEYEKGDQPGDGIAKAKKYSEDMLMYLASQTSSDGSKV